MIKIARKQGDSLRCTIRPVCDARAPRGRAVRPQYTYAKSSCSTILGAAFPFNHHGPSAASTSSRTRASHIVAADLSDGSEVIRVLFIVRCIAIPGSAVIPRLALAKHSVSCDDLDTSDPFMPYGRMGAFAKKRGHPSRSVTSVPQASGYCATPV